MAPLPWYALPQYAPIGIISVTTGTIEGGSYRSTNDLSVEGGLETEIFSYGFKIFFIPNISESQVGSTYTLDSGPVFQQTVDFLTKGRMGWLTFGIGSDPYYARSYVKGKNNLNGNYPGVDLMGFTIEGLDLSINSYRAWQKQQTDGRIFYFCEVATTFIIRGSFPFTRKEPPPPEGPSPPVDGSTVVAKVR